MRIKLIRLAGQEALSKLNKNRREANGKAAFIMKSCYMVFHFLVSPLVSYDQTKAIKG